MQTILVFGATGAVGAYLLAGLAAHYRVIGVSRQRQPDCGQWVCAGLNDADADWPDADIVISAGPLDAFAQWLQHNHQPALKRVVALSSMSAQTKRDSLDQHERELAARLAASEATLMDTCATRDIACTLFRPTLIYGAGTDRSLAPIARFAQRWHMLPIPVGASGLRQPIHAADIAQACMTVLTVSTTFGQIYPLGGGERLRFDSLVTRLRRAMPGFVFPMPVPLVLLRFTAKYLRLGAFTPSMVARLRQPLIADNAPAQRDFGFNPRNFCADQVLPTRARKAPSAR